jgi:hypothetical protein
MFWPAWPSSGVYDISLFIPEGICFAAFVACGYTMQFLICVCSHATKTTKATKQIPSGIKSAISYTPEDGHVV